MVWFQSKQYRAEGLSLAPKFLDSVNLIIVEICHNSSAEAFFPRCKTPAVAFLPQIWGCCEGFLARRARLSIPCHS
ncbi:protein of unknown function [Bradyrhizobium vignae]|uniref:Uncharacterized protein n=1 Tax=Bradyrhizobium vignae TaxID=1549949 RepID=A0A2U3Q7B7_9BRAD|nr:protein of unknown function [Bradyrhizobium vignae]